MVKSRRQQAVGSRQKTAGALRPALCRPLFLRVRHYLFLADDLRPSPFRQLFTIYCLLPTAYCLLFFPLSIYGSAPPLTCRIAEIAPRSRSLSVTCALAALPPGKLQLRFADQFAGVLHLSERVFALKVKDADGAVLPLEIRGDGLFSLSLKERTPQLNFSYELHLARALDPAQYALVSSLGAEAGFLMLSDLLPQVCAEAESGCGAQANSLRLQITAPDGWQIATTEQSRGNFFELADSQSAVFFLGHLREQELSVSGMKLHVAIAGDWSVADERVARLVEEITREQAAMIGGQEQGDFLVTLAPFPLPMTGLRSSGLTRSHTVILMFNPGEDPARAFAQYQRHLAHELFHFYLPNAFRIRENFDWFWEGFTRYTALTTLLRLRLITLRDYLDALGEEYEAYTFNPLRARLSLLAASPDKFANPASYELVYRKGMLVAALYDLELRWQSGGRQSLMDVLRALYQTYASTDISGGREIGNREVLAELAKVGDFARFIREDIEGTREIDLATAIKPYGLVIDRDLNSRGRSRLSVTPKPSVKQRELISHLEK